MADAPGARVRPEEARENTKKKRFNEADMVRAWLARRIEVMGFTGPGIAVQIRRLDAGWSQGVVGTRELGQSYKMGGKKSRTPDQRDRIVGEASAQPSLGVDRGRGAGESQAGPKDVFGSDGSLLRVV